MAKISPSGILISMGMLFYMGCSVEASEIPPYFSQHQGMNEMLDKPVEVKDVQALKQLQTAPWAFSLTLASKGKAKNVANCQDMMDSVKNGYQAKASHEQMFVDATHLTCQLLQESLNLKPSKVSYLNKVSLDKSFTQQAPAQLAMLISNEQIKKVANSKSWDDMSQIKSVKPLNQDQTIFYDDTDGQQKVTLIAKGDHNGDGVEDLLLYMENSVISGSYAAAHAFILTKKGEGKPLELLKQF